MPRARGQDQPPALVAFEWSGVLVQPTGPVPWPGPAVALPLLTRLRLDISPGQLEAAVRYVLLYDTPSVRLRTLAEAADQLAFRLGLEPRPGTVRALRGLLAGAPEPVPTPGALAALRALRSAGAETLILADHPPYCPLGTCRGLLRAAGGCVWASEEGSPLGSPTLYRRIVARRNLRPAETVLVTADALGSLAAARRLGMRVVLVADAGGRPPRMGQLATAVSMAEAAEFLTARFYAGLPSGGPSLPSLESGVVRDEEQGTEDETGVPEGLGDRDGGMDDADGHPLECAGAEREPGAE
jgi:hypothetical protein